MDLRANTVDAGRRSARSSDAFIVVSEVIDCIQKETGNEWKFGEIRRNSFFARVTGEDARRDSQREKMGLLGTQNM